MRPRESPPSRWAPLVILGTALAIGGWNPGSASAQDWDARFEVRAGAAYASALAESPVRLDPDGGFGEIGAVEMGAGVAPFLGAGVLFDAGYLLWAELQAGFSMSSVRAEGPGGTWDAGDLTRLHVTGGLRVGLGNALYVRGAVGFLVQSAPDLIVFTEGDDTGILLAGALGYQPVETVPVSVEVEGQRFDFGTTALRRSGAADGAVGRILVTLSWRPGAGEER